MVKSEDCMFCGKEFYPTMAHGNLTDCRICCPDCNGNTIEYPVKVSYRDGGVTVLTFDFEEDAESALFFYAKLPRVKRCVKLSPYKKVKQK